MWYSTLKSTKLSKTAVFTKYLSRNYSTTPDKNINSYSKKWNDLEYNVVVE